MFYCPKCQLTYDEGVQRFCSNDGIRLLPAPSSGKSVNQSAGVFTNLLSRTVSKNANDEIVSSRPRFVKAETFISEQSDSFVPTEVVLKNISNFSVENELQSPVQKSQKPLPRIIKLDEVPASQAKLGERRTNLTIENAEVLIGRTIKGRYQIIKELDADESSISYLAEDKIVSGKKVVVRVLLDEDDSDDFANKIFAEERVSLSLVNHPNIARVLDSGELIEGKPFIVCEFAEGESVQEMLRKTEHFNPLRAARIISQTADALSEAHRNGVLHRNLKPENIILTVSESGNEQVKVTNFGVFKNDLNKENLVYKSPEQIEGKSANFASDIYSLAVIAYQMLTNRLPFSGSSNNELLRAQREGLNIHPTNLRLDLPRTIDKVIEKGLNFNASERYPKIREFGDSLYNSLTAANNFDETSEIGEIESITDEDVEKAFSTSSHSSDNIKFNPVIEENPQHLASFAVENGKVETGTNEIIKADKAEIKPVENNELPWEKRSPDQPQVSSRTLTVFAITGLLLLLAGIWGIWAYFLNRPPEVESIKVPVESVFPTENENINSAAPTPQEIEVPPLPRSIPQPPNTVYFQNSKEGLKGDLAKNFLGFSLYYPKDWKENEAKGKYLDISKEASSGTPIEQMLVSYYDSKGTFKADTDAFPALIEETNKTLKEIVPSYEVVSEGEKNVNNGWRAYEIKFKGSGKTAKGEDLTLWGRRLFIPTGRPGMKNGYVITMLATSLSPDVKSVDDVGVKGELATILESFEPNQNF